MADRKHNRKRKATRSAKAKVRRGNGIVRKMITVTLPDGSKVRVRKAVKVLPPSPYRDGANVTFKPVSHAGSLRMRRPGGRHRSFQTGYAAGWDKVIKAGKIFGFKGGR